MVTCIQFKEAIAQLVPLQHELKVLAAWVKMGRTLIISPQNKSKFTEGSSVPFSKGHSMGLWINGAEEKVAVWFIEMGIPVFVVHKTQLKADAQFFNKETTHSRFPFDNCDLEFAPIPLRFHNMLEASKGQLRLDLSWKVGFNAQVAQPMHQIIQWQSFFRANHLNFLGEQSPSPKLHSRYGHSHTLRKRAREYTEKCEIPVNPFGFWAKSLLETHPGLRDNAMEHLISVGKYVQAHDIVLFLD
ncbi:hypothetical protein BDP27DRAFT_1427678 [Rhodocollybia butyracea]|uniref:Uncharacterized protein n=1 Tax=Rhodocollybia butyracea TaxID=206335 RepID=A0A9P5PFV5_9AGAR|nr:hypothetical protein BDP27DRAFT_1427678 [Rhodocollybia butyracea]